MPLFDFQCAYCEHAFEGLAKPGAVVRCPRCLCDVPSPTVTKASATVVEARIRGVAEGTKARDGDDLEQYARQYGADCASELASEYWFSAFAKEAERAAKAQGVDWATVEDDAAAAFHAGFEAACGDCYDDDDKEDDG